MKTRLIFAAKYLFFAFIAFTVPKIIVDSGRLVAPLERSSTPSANAPPKPRSLWPFRFLPTSAAPPRAASNPEPFVAAPSDLARSQRFAVGGSADRAGRNGFNDVAIPPTGAAFGDERDFPAPNLADFERSSFADRFAESELAPSIAGSALNPGASSFARSSPRPLEELFRFGRSPAWFVENWPRVDAIATEDGLVGYRVAVSTGNANDDVVGVYAAYFDATSERRIEFSGQTGDYRKILQFLQREYGAALSPRSTAERFVYESTLSNGRGGATPGRLVVRPTRVFLRGAEKSFFEVDVFLERPYNRQY